MDNVSVASVTLSYNAERVLPQQLDALLRQSRPLDQMIVVDNNSTDGTLDLLARCYPTVTVLRLPTNAGAAGGYAAGLRFAALEARHDWIWLLDQDSIPSQDSLEQLLNGLTSSVESAEQNLGIAASLPTHSEAQLAYPGLIWRNGFRPPSPEQLSEPLCFVDAVISSGSLIRREVVERVGLPREDLFIDFVDFEYCLRIRGGGYAIAVVGASLIDHVVGEPRTTKFLGYSKTWSSHAPWREYYMSRNETFTIWSYYPNLGSKVYVLRRLFRHAAATILFGQKRRACLKMMLVGFLDGRAGRLGMRVPPNGQEAEPRVSVASVPTNEPGKGQ